MLTLAVELLMVLTLHLPVGLVTVTRFDRGGRGGGGGAGGVDVKDLPRPEIKFCQYFS